MHRSPKPQKKRKSSSQKGGDSDEDDEDSQDEEQKGGKATGTEVQRKTVESPNAGTTISAVKTNAETKTSP